MNLPISKYVTVITFINCCITSIIFLSCCNQDPKSGEEKSIIYCEEGETVKLKKSLDSILKSLYESDQKIRNEIVNIRLEKKLKPNEYRHLYDKMDSIDSINIFTLIKLMKIHGWPNDITFSKQSLDAPFLIILHNSDNSKIEESLNHFVNSAYKKDNISNVVYATLIDAILLGNYKKQKYGTHCRKAGGKIHYHYSLNNEIINKNRKDIQLDSLTFTGCELEKF